MKYNILILSVLFAISCTNSPSGEIAEKDSNEKYDVENRLLIDGEAGNLDTLKQVRKILRTEKIFGKGRAYHYSAVYTDRRGDLLSKSRVIVVPTGKQWKQDAQQREIRIIYDHTAEDRKKFDPHPLNENLTNWSEETFTGVIENVERLWMHPFRENQFIFTQVAPFPSVRFPLEKGMTWEASLQIHKGWGNWSGLEGTSTYKVVDQIERKLPFADVGKCWLIKSWAVFPFGTSYLDLFYHEEFGFTEMHYTNYVGENLKFFLVRVEDQRKESK